MATGGHLECGLHTKHVLGVIGHTKHVLGVIGPMPCGSKFSLRFTLKATVTEIKVKIRNSRWPPAAILNVVSTSNMFYVS